MLGDPITNVPHVPRRTAFLEASHMVRNPVEVLEKYRRLHGETFSFHFGGARRAVVSTNPEILHHVLKANRDNYEKSEIQTARMVEFQGTGLVNLHGQDWLRQRKLIARGFAVRRLAELLPLQQSVLADRIPRIDDLADEGPIDIREEMVHLTLALVGASIFGRNMTETELRQVAETISDIQSFVVRQIVKPYLIPWYRISGQTEKYQRLRRAADRLILDHIAARRATGTGDLDLLRIFLTEPFHDTRKPMSEVQALTESVQMLVAGNETSSIALTWVFYLISRHPDHAERIRAEIDEFIDDAPISSGMLGSMIYTIQVIQEALRLYPPFWMIDRMAIADDEIQGIHIPAETMVIPYIYGTHRNPAIWDDPDRFDPARFARDRVKARHPLSYIPFGGGPRVCIGNNMAMQQILLIVATLMRRYDFSPATNDPIAISPMMLLRPDGPVPLWVRRR